MLNDQHHPTDRSKQRPVADADISECDREPIRIPGSIQPHGALLVLAEHDGRVIQASANTGEMLGVEAESLLGQPLHAAVGEGAAALILASIRRVPPRARPALAGKVSRQGSGARRTFYAIVHRSDDQIVLELEIAPDGILPDDIEQDFHPLLDEFTLHAEDAVDVAELSHTAAQAIRQLTGFDRVLVYRFDEQWNGMVVGEDGNGRLPSYMNHHFPAWDIPAQARELYRINRVRIIPDAHYQAVPLVPETLPATGQPLDMSMAVLRSVSPIHVEYMRNMETLSSMSVSIVRGGVLWGLISCHHTEPKFVSFPLRRACELFARAFSLRLTAIEYGDDYRRRIEVRSAYAKLLAFMADRGDYAVALEERSDELLALAGAEGAAIVTEGECRLIGRTPGAPLVRELSEWLFRVVKRDVYHTDSLAQAFTPARAAAVDASGLLAVSISKLYPSYVMWFRPEMVRTIAWGGNPHKVESNGGPRRLHPRRSFATWEETVRERAFAWDPSEIEAAGELRNAIVGIVLRKAEELAGLNAELTRSNKELEAFSYSVSHDLRAPLRHIVGYADMLRDSLADRLTDTERRHIGEIISSSEYAGKLVDKLLDYSRLGRSELQTIGIELNGLVGDVRKDVMRDAVGRDIEWNVGTLPRVHADLMMLRMAVRDLLSNAVKYTRQKDKAVIEVGAREEASEHVIWVKDNGVGFDMKYVDKLFGVFQRLHRWEDYEGTGIGLANVRRVIERHGGRTWATGEEDQGATIYFSLPKHRG